MTTTDAATLVGTCLGYHLVLSSLRKSRDSATLEDRKAAIVASLNETFDHYYNMYPDIFTDAADTVLEAMSLSYADGISTGKFDDDPGEVRRQGDNLLRVFRERLGMNPAPSPPTAPELLSVVGEHSDQAIKVAALGHLFPALAYSVQDLPYPHREGLLRRAATYLDQHQPVGPASMPAARPAARKLLRLLAMTAGAAPEFFEGLFPPPPPGS